MAVMILLSPPFPLLPLLLLLLLAGPPLLLLLSTASALVRNYQKAQTTGLPILVVPVSYSNPLWLVIGRHVAPWFRHLPFGWARTAGRIGYSGWEWAEKYSIHDEYGPGFVVVTPVQNWLYTCDGDALYRIFHGERQGDIERPTELWAMLECFGPNVITATGEDWRRHRKVTAAAFTERTNRLAWAEALRQAAQVLRHWEAAGPGGVTTTPRDCKTVALNILVSAGFGRSRPFAGGEDEDEDEDEHEHEPGTRGPRLGYHRSLRLVLENILVVFLVGPERLGRIAWPGRLAEVGAALRSFHSHMKSDLEAAKTAWREKGGTQGTLMANLVRALVETDGKAAAAAAGGFGISEREVFGNMFAYHFSGHDTTARSLNFTFYLLAAYPEVQDWMREEMNRVFPDVETSAPLPPSYDSIPRLNRCMAVLHEVLRLYHVLGIVPRRTRGETSLRIGGRTHRIPAQTLLLFNMHAAHADPQYWGDDSLAFRPSRWIRTTPPAAGGDEVEVEVEAPPTSMDREFLVKPPRTAYMSWLDASHACPGRRFSQVEYVALMVGLLRSHCVEPAREWVGEDVEHARQRARECLADSGTRLVFEMLRPETVPLVWRQCPS